MDLLTTISVGSIAVALGALTVQIIVWRTSRTDAVLRDINTSLREIAAALYETKQP